jgi:hypothetical protein
MKGNRGAFAALALAGGLWAWRNRDKIQSWVNSQRSQSGSSTFTGDTRRFQETEQPRYDSSSSSPRIYPSPETL